MATNFSLTIGGTERKAVIAAETFRVQERAGIATCSFDIIDKTRSITVADNAEVIALDGATRIFGGYVREVVSDVLGRTRILHVTCQDFNVDLDEDIIPEPASRSTVESDRARVQWLMTTHGTKGITSTTYTSVVLASMPGGSDGIPRQEFGGKTFREALNYIARLSGAAYHVDFNRELHWYSATTGEALTAAFHLSDTPNMSTTFPHFGLTIPRNVAAYRNAVYVTGTGISGWRPNPPPSAATRRAGVLRDEGITSQAQLDAAGDAFLAAHQVETSASCYLVRAGLRTGMAVQITSAVYGLTAQAYMVREQITRLDAQQSPIYELTLGAPLTTLGGVIGSAVALADRALETALEAGAGSGEPVANLQIGGANLLPNSSFESASAPSWAIGAQWAFGYQAGVATAHSGSRTGRVTVAAASVGNLDTPMIAVDRTTDYWASAWNFLRSRTAGTVIIEVLEYNAVPTLLATNTLRSVSAADTAWNRVALRLGPNTSYGRTAFNAATTQVRFRFRATGTATLTWDIDSIQLERSSLLTAWAPTPYELMDQQIVGAHIADAAIGSTHIGDDSIESPHIQAGAVDANKIAANAITTGKLAAGAITADKIAASGIAADSLTSGTLTLGGVAGSPDVLIVYDVAGDEILRLDMTGLTIIDALDPQLVMRLTEGRLEFSTNGGTSWQTAMTGEGIVADAIRLGTFPGGHNSMPNAGFEMAAFAVPLTKVWTLAADFGTTIGTDVNVTKTNNDLRLTTITY